MGAGRHSVRSEALRNEDRVVAHFGGSRTPRGVAHPPLPQEACFLWSGSLAIPEVRKADGETFFDDWSGGISNCKRVLQGHILHISTALNQ